MSLVYFSVSTITYSICTYACVIQSFKCITSHCLCHTHEPLIEFLFCLPAVYINKSLNIARRDWIVDM